MRKISTKQAMCQKEIGVTIWLSSWFLPLLQGALDAHLAEGGGLVGTHIPSPSIMLY